MNIQIDDREVNQDLLEAMKMEKDLTIRIGRLPVGDYLVDNNLLVERKTIIDFCSSIKDGRLFQQAAKLAAMPMQSIYILEGVSCHFEAVGFRREAVQGALVTLSLLYKIPLLRSKTPEETAKLMIYAARQIKAKDRQQVHVRPYPYSRRLNEKIKRQIYVLQGLPGIGPKRASVLLDKFKTLKAIFNALPQELGETPGIGKKIAKQIKRIIE